MVNWSEFDEKQRKIHEEQQTLFDVRKGLFDFPATDPTKLLEKPMNPVNDFDGIINRDTTTSNLQNPQTAKDISFLLTSAVALNEAREVFGIKDDPEADKWIKATITNIKASASSRTAVSKGIKGWLGELFVTLKRRGEITAEFTKGKTGLLK